MRKLPPVDLDKLDELGRFVAARLAARTSMSQAAAEQAVRHVTAERGQAALVDLVLQLGVESPERQLLGRFLTAAYDTLGEEPFLSRDLIAQREVGRPAIDDVVALFAPPHAPYKTRLHQVAQFLKRNAGLSVDGYHLEAVGADRGSTLWAVCAVE